MELESQVCYQLRRANNYSILCTCLAASFIELVKYIFTNIPSVKFFLSEKISQDPIEKFFGCQRQRGSTNENPTVQQACKNTQALRVINSACKHVSRGNTRGNKPYDEDNLDQPLMKRQRKQKK